LSVKYTLQLMQTCHELKHAMILRGRHGIGKSTIPEQYARDNGYYFEHQFATGQETSDLVGLTKEKLVELNGEEITIQYWTMPVWLYRLWEKHYQGIKTVLLVDEVNRANEEVIQMTLSLLNDRKIHEHSIPPDCLILTAINPESDDAYEGVDYNVKFLDKAIYSRVWLIDLKITPEEWLEWGNINNVNPMVLEFIKQNPGQLHNPIPGQSNHTDPRSWVRFADALTLQEEKLNDKEVDKSFLLFMAKAKLGESSGYVFAEFYYTTSTFSYSIYKKHVKNELKKYKGVIGELNDYHLREYERSLYNQNDGEYNFDESHVKRYNELKEVFYTKLIPDLQSNLKSFYKTTRVDDPLLLDISNSLYKDIVNIHKEEDFIGLKDVVYYMAYLYSLDHEIMHASLKTFQEYCNNELGNLYLFINFNSLDNDRHLVKILKNITDKNNSGKS
jgi:hypothetical protein